MARCGPSSRGTIQRAHGDAALELICTPWHLEREGYRHLWLGDSRMGKSTANYELLEYAKQNGFVVVGHDDVKREQQIAGAVREHPADMAARSLTDGEDKLGAVVFRGNAVAGRIVEVEDVAAYGLKLARAGSPTVVAVDELDRAMTDAGGALVSASLGYALTQGGALACSVAATTQEPTRVPRQFKSQCTSVGYFRLSASGNYLRERLNVDPRLVDVVEQLQPHEFVVDVKGTPWNRIVYTFA